MPVTPGKFVSAHEFTVNWFACGVIVRSDPPTVYDRLPTLFEVFKLTNDVKY